MSVSPPRIARWLIGRCAAPQDREFSLGDIEEQFADRAGESRAGARRWYWKQAFQAIRHRLDASTLTGAIGALVVRGVANTSQDVRSAARGLRRSPGFVAVAGLTLALGIGANAMIYAVVDAVIIRGLPFDDADRLVLVRNGYTDARVGAWMLANEGADAPGTWLLSFPDYEDYASGLRSFDQLAAWRAQRPALASAPGQPAQRLHAVDATANLLPTLGVQPFLGRGFLPEEDVPNAERPSAILSYSLWQNRHGGDEAVLGSTILLDEVPFQVVGVLPPGFTGVAGGFVLPAEPVDIWLSYRSSFSGTAQGESGSALGLRGLTNVNAIGRLLPGVSLEQARDEAGAIAGSLAERFPDSHENSTARILVAQDEEVRGVRSSLLLSFGAVSLLLLIACTNVANLLIGRASTRRREMALRAALGAGRARLVRQLVCESLLLAALGTLAGTVFATLGLRLLSQTDALEIARLHTAAVDARVLAVMFAVAAVTGLAFGVGPALFATRGGPGEALRSGGRSLTGTRSFTRRALVVGQVGLAVVLLVGAGLLLRSFAKVLDVDPGFRTDGIVTAWVQRPMAFVSPEWQESVDFFEQYTQRIRALPGVRTVAAAYQLPTDAGWNNAFDFDLSSMEKPPRDLAEGDNYYARFSPVTPGYFEVVGIPVVRGRTFTEADRADAPRVVIVNEAFVATFLDPTIDPLGTRLIYGNWWARGEPEYEIVGVVRDVRFAGRTRNSSPATYFPHAQQPVPEMSIVIAADGDPLALVPALRGELEAVDPAMPLDDVDLLSSRLAGQEAARRSLATLLAVFSSAALTLAAIGVYGVMSFLVARRTRELGLRQALGARRTDVRRMVLLSGVRLAASGLLAGLAGAYFIGGIVESLLYDVRPSDPGTFGLVACFLAVIALLASWIPARRATAVDPMISLRGE